MINHNELRTIFNRCNGNLEIFAQVIRSRYDSKKSSLANVFTIARNMGVRIILSDFGEDAAQLITNEEGQKAYIVLQYDSNIERLRFNTACMLYELLAKQTEIPEDIFKHKESINFKDAKKFASALLMPSRELQDELFKHNEDGSFTYLDEYGLLSWENIHFIAAHFGVDFSTCAKRIYRLPHQIKGVRCDEDFYEYLEQTDQHNRTRAEMIPDYAFIQIEHKKDLIDCLHYVRQAEVNDDIKEEIATESTRQFSSYEGVRQFEFLDKFVALYSKTGGEEFEEKKEEILRSISEEQRIAIGNYVMLSEMSRNLNDGYHQERIDRIPEVYRQWTCRNMKNVETSMPIIEDTIKEFQDKKITYAEAVRRVSALKGMDEFVADKILEDFIAIDEDLLRNMNKNLYMYALNITFIPGEFRSRPVQVNYEDYNEQGPTMDVSEVVDVYRDTLAWCQKARELVKRAEALTPSQYVEELSKIVVEIWKIQPFRDGNKRVTKALTNYLLSYKDLPCVFANNNNLTEKQMAALIELSKASDGNYDAKQLNRYNDVVFDCICNCYPYFFEADRLYEQPLEEIKSYRKK
jgi:fido (protein-threonine AMPylation protein)